LQASIGSRRLARVVFVSVVLALPPASHAGGAPGLSELAIPGGRSTLTLAGVPASTPRGLALPLAIRLLHGDPPGSTAEQDDRLARVRMRLEQIARVRAALGDLENGEVGLPAPGDAAAAGRVSAALDAMGLRLDRAGDAYRADLQPGDEAASLRAALADAGLDTEGVLRALAGTSRVRPSIGSVTVPLPFEPDMWSRALLASSLRSAPLADSLLLDREGALTACGLLAVDAQTRAWLATRPHVMRRLSYRGGVLCAFGRSVHVEQDRLQLPGGPAAAPVWEALADHPLSPLESFLPALFMKDEGRLAYFLDTVARAEPGVRAALLSTSGKDGLKRVKATYAAFVESTGLWRPAERPFVRPLYDAALLVDELSADASGRLAGPRWQRFWRVAFDDASLPRQPARLLRKLDKDGAADPGGLIRATMLPNVDERRARFEQIAFVLRVMPRPSDAELPDVLVAARGYARFPALLLQLERLGVTAPALLAATARRADALDAIGDEGRRAQALAQFQGALALLDGAVAGRFLVAADAVGLVAALAAVEPIGDQYLGGVARWVDGRLAPALGVPAGADVEAAVLRSWAGPRHVTSQPLAWEGQQYLIDPTDAELDRLRRLREVQGTSGLDAALALSRVLASVAAAGTVDAVKVAAAGLPEAATALPAAPDRSFPSLDPAGDVAADVVRALGRSRKKVDAKAVQAALEPLWRQADRSLAHALVSLAYTRHLGDPETSVITGDALAERHEFGRGVMSWSRAQDSGDATGRHMHGGIIGLDLAFARLSLRRLSTDAVPPARTVNENVIDEVRQTVMLSFRHPPSEADLDAVAEALRKGRARLDAAARDAEALDRLAVEAGVSDVRRLALPWMAVEEPGALPSVFSAAEQARLGGATALPAAFGTSTADLEGCWCLRVPRPRPWEDVAARPGQPRVAAQVPDLGLRLASEMRALGVPAAVYPWMLALAAEEYLDRAATQFPEDWPALVEAANSLSRERVEDYVSGLAGAGPLRMRQEPTR
jgi:hypothetical protein